MTNNNAPYKLYNDPMKEFPMYSFDDDIRICYINIIVDISGSMSRHQDNTIKAIRTTLTELAKRNNDSEDIETRVRLVTFNHEQKVINEEFLKPKHLLDILDDKDLECFGTTNLGAIIDYLDNQFTHTSPMLQNLHSNDPKLYTVFISDYCGTDVEEVRNKALDKLLSNRYFLKANKTLCIYTGDPAHKHHAIRMAGSENNIISLSVSENLAKYLTPVLIDSTINNTDATHTNNTNENLTPREIAEEAIARNNDAKIGAEALSKDSNNIAELLRKQFGL